MIPYSAWSIDLVASIASVFPWSHAEILRLPIGAAFHYAMRATSIRWQRIDDMRMAATFAHGDEKSQRSLIDRINVMASGPGQLVRWEDQLTPEERLAAEEVNRERDRVYEALKASGILCDVTGNRSLNSFLKRA